MTHATTRRAGARCGPGSYRSIPFVASVRMRANVPSRLLRTIARLIAGTLNYFGTQGTCKVSVPPATPPRSKRKKTSAKARRWTVGQRMRLALGCKVCRAMLKKHGVHGVKVALSSEGAGPMEGHLIPMDHSERISAATDARVRGTVGV